MDEDLLGRTMIKHRTDKIDHVHAASSISPCSPRLFGLLRHLIVKYVQRKQIMNVLAFFFGI